MPRRARAEAGRAVQAKVSIRKAPLWGHSAPSWAGEALSVQVGVSLGSGKEGAACGQKAKRRRPGTASGGKCNHLAC